MLKSETFSEMKRNIPKETPELKVSLHTSRVIPGGKKKVIPGVIQAPLKQC